VTSLRADETAQGADGISSAPGVGADATASAAAEPGSPPAVQAEETPGLARREERSPRDMSLSLAVLIVPIALLLIFYRVVLSGDSPVTVDASPTIQEAQQAAAFPVAVPQGLGDNWHTSSATFNRQPDGATLRIGYVDQDKDPVQLVQSSVPASTLLPTELSRDAKPAGTFRAPNGVWRLYDGRPGEKALVLADPNRTIVVVGKAGVANLQTLAASLR
jgi:hypothetical protein